MTVGMKMACFVWSKKTFTICFAINEIFRGKECHSNVEYSEILVQCRLDTVLQSSFVYLQSEWVQSKSKLYFEFISILITI